MAECVRELPRRKSRVHVQSESDLVNREEETNQPLPTTTTEIGFHGNSMSTTVRSPTKSLFTTAKTTQNDMQIEKGRHAALSGDYRTAIKIFSEISPSTYHSLFYSGCARLKLNEKIEIHNAIEDFNQALKLLHSSGDVNIYYKRAFACQLIGRYAEAIIDYTMFIEKSPSHGKHIGYLNRGLVYNEMKEYTLALEDINRAYENCGQPSKYYVYCLARAQASIGHADNAKAKFQELAEICLKEYQSSMKSYEIIFYYGIALYELGDYSNALQLLNETLIFASNNQEKAEVMFYIGLIDYACNDIETAKKDFQDTLKFNQNHARALFRLGLIESQNENLQLTAIDHLTEAHRLLPHKSDILYARGDLHRRMGHLDACVRDKRLAMHLGRVDTDPSSLKHYYELLTQQLSLKTKNQTNVPNEIYLMLALLHDKMHTLIQYASKSSTYNKDYRQSIIYYERGIERSKNTELSPIYFALLFNLHKHHKQPGAAMIALDQFHAQLDENPQFEKYWEQMMREVQEKARIQDFSQKENLLQILSSQMTQLMTDQQNVELLYSLLASRFDEFQRLEKCRNKVKVDKEHFQKDQNKNRLVFYDKMRSSLSHKFVSMAVVSGDDYNEPIVQHDKTGTKTMIAEGVSILGSAISDAMPTGGTVLTAATGFVSYDLKQREYKEYQNRMAVVTDVGTIEDLTDVARQVARQLADRYEEQLLLLKPRLKEPPIVCLSGCPCFRRKNQLDPLPGRPPIDVLQPPQQLAQIALVFTIEAIINGKINEERLNDDTKCDDLAQVITELICCAKPNLKTKVFRSLGLDKNITLPHTPLPNAKEGQSLDKWYAHDFYCKPAIRILDGETASDQAALSWMDSVTYGFRLGTLDEYNHLKALHDKEQEKNTKSCCCC